MSADIAKFNAAQAALDFVKDGMVVGLGTGSTSATNSCRDGVYNGRHQRSYTGRSVEL